MPYIELESVEQREVAPGCHARFVHSDNLTISYWDLDPGAEIPPHSHPHEQITSAIDGEFELTVSGETKLMRSGCVWVIAGGAEHRVHALTACRVIDVFYPIREDYR